MVQAFALDPAVLGEIGTLLSGLAAMVGINTFFQRRQDRRDGVRLAREQWRITYCNLNVTADHVLTRTVNAPMPGEGSTLRSPRGLGSATPDTPLTQYSIFRLEIENIGQGPVDVWACLVSAREVNAGDHVESWGGNIEWNDLDPYYYDASDPDVRSLAGISNTRPCVYSQDYFVRLAPKEHDTLTRIDRIEPVTAYRTILYRAVLIGRGYDGGLATDLLARRQLQQALFTVSGPAFRLLFDLDDPLDLVADRDGWQCFMLYHLAFTDQERDQRGWTRVDRLNAQLVGRWGAAVSEEQAREYCRGELAELYNQWKGHWEAFQQAVAQCRILPGGFADLLASNWRPAVSAWTSGNSRLDLTQISAREAFRGLPRYLKWDPSDNDSLPVWQKFFVVTLRPDGASDGQDSIASVVR